MTAGPPPTGDAPARSRPCPICDGPSTAAFTPFCSRRCADVDLHRWLKGAYALPADPTDEDGLSDDEPGRD